MIRFFKKLAAALFAPQGDDKPLSHREYEARFRELVANPDAQKRAKAVGNSRRRKLHAQGAQDAYRAKVAKVAVSKGNNTLAGIPRWWLIENNIATLAQASNAPQP